MSLIPTNRNNPCPICEDVAGRCRQGREDQDYWQCMSYADARKGGIVAGGYKCIGHTRDHLWGQFKFDNTQEWSDERRQDSKRENQRRQQQKAREDEQRRRQSLSAEQRHEQYTRMLSELTLHPDDRADLVRRGFSLDQIELAGFKSIERYQRLDSEFSTLLPGISGNGKRLIIPFAGYLCPVRDVDGLIVALQVRLRTLPTSESGRYRWLSGDGQVLHLFPEGCQPEGELPLAVYHPQQINRGGTGLCEGTGAKPFLSAQRLGIPFIGAAGGLFTSSQRLLEIYLEKLNCDRGQEIIIPIDGGDILNNQVLARWHRVIALVEKLGYSVQIAWWNQVTKDCPDIDELDNLDSIQYLTPAEFNEVVDAARKEFGFKARINLNLSEVGNNQEEQVVDKKRGFADHQPSHQQNYAERARARWSKNRQFTVGEKNQKSSQWCEWTLPPKNSIFFGKAGLGRGKTTNLKDWVRVWKLLEENTGFVCLGYRNTLLYQLCEKLGFYHIRDEDTRIMMSDPRGGIALCVDSLLKLNPEFFDDKVVFLDEVKSVVKHLLHSPTVRNRDKVLERFGEAIRRARQVICLDGLMADWIVDYLHELAPEKQIIKAENTYQGNKPIINLLLGTIDAFDEKKRVKVNDRSPWLKFLLEDSPVPAVCADSQVLIEALDNLLSEKGMNVLRIDSKTVCEDYVKEFLKDCNAYIDKQKPDVLLYTPSAESGVDVSIPDYFSHHFGFFFGAIDIDAMLQMLGRIRDTIPKFVWCKSFLSEDEKQHSKSPFAESIEKSINQLLASDISTSLSDTEAWKESIINHLSNVIANSNNIHFRASCLIDSIQNYEKSNLRECLKEALLESGYKIRACTLPSFEEFGKQAKQETDEVKKRNCHDIFTAEKIPFELVDEFRFKEKWEERVKVIQAKLRERLPGIEETATWTEEFIYKIRYEDRDFISHQEMFWLFSHPEVAKRLSQEKLHWMARNQKIFIGNLKSQWAKVNALHQIGLDWFLRPGREWSEETPEVVSLFKLCKHPAITNSLGKHPGKQSRTRFVGSLLEMIGLKQKARKDADGNRHYSIDESVVTDNIRVQVLKCLITKWQKYLDKDVELLDWDAAINEANEGVSEKQPQTQSQQDLKGTARVPQNVYISNIVPAVNYSEEKPEDAPLNEANGVAPEKQFQTQSQQDLKGTARVPQNVYTSQGVPAVTQGEGVESLDELINRLEKVSTSEQFWEVARHCSSEQIEDAILFQKLDIRYEMRAWYESKYESKTEDTAVEVADVAPRRPPLSAYREGEQVWAYIPSIVG